MQNTNNTIIPFRQEHVSPHISVHIRYRAQLMNILLLPWLEPDGDIETKLEFAIKRIVSVESNAPVFNDGIIIGSKNPE